ncbi:hypothetical protein PV08_05294 [Exophiala spinifera]|uniref:PLD phosphodiesterase domain-containing protein n=1 Tax=Exophiala spinifera TaxID=91928 RepID=A0A0D2BVE6_9EURO|nr:uncharacterized protein PV08_05294 [Exophiala spinifera]KIW15249.1 hypothetical protein PV08_05294 [Exophiala spinifera]
MEPENDQPGLVDLVSDSESDEEVFDHLNPLGNEPVHSSIITPSHGDPMSAMRSLFPTDRSPRCLLPGRQETSDNDLSGSSSGNGGDSANPAVSTTAGIVGSKTQKPVIVDIIDEDDSSGSHTEAGSDSDSKGFRVLPGSSSNAESDRRAHQNREEDGTNSKHTTTIDLSQLSDEDDEDWRRAIALSLRDSTAQNAGNDSPSEKNSSKTESEDEDLKKAIALSLLDTDAVGGPNSSASCSSPKGNDQRGILTAKPERRREKSKETKINGIDAAVQHAEGGMEKSSDTIAIATTSSDTLVTSTPEPDSIAGSTLKTNTKPLDRDASTKKSGFSILALNRKQMEEERLARLKRKREGDMNSVNGKDSKTLRLDQNASSETRKTKISPPPSQRRAHRTGTQETSISRPIGVNRNAAGQGIPSTSASSIRNHSSAPSTTPQLFPEGKIFKTALADSSNVSSIGTISFDQLVSPSTSLESALLSSFIWDFDWLFPHFDTKRTKFQLVMHGKSASQRTSITSDFSGLNNVRITFPPVEGITNCMHSKLMLLFYRDELKPALAPPLGVTTRLGDGETKEQDWSKRCRVVIPTANLVGFDWGVGSFMENTVFLIDLPLKSPGVDTRTQFETSLRAFLKAQTVPDDVLTKLSKFDFDRASHLAFVHTLGGAHTNRQVIQSTGLPGLANAVAQLGLATCRDLQLDYVTSSLGNLNEAFMRNVYWAAQGDISSFGLAAASMSSSSSTSRSEARDNPAGLLDGARGKEKQEEDAWRRNFRIYYPSDTTVRTSKGGMQNAGTICFSGKWWAQQSFPQSNLRDCISLREGLLMHNKILYVRPTLATLAGTAVPHSSSHEHSRSILQPQRPWVYLGSANLSESAWGKLVEDRSTRQPKLNCRNWECGVIIQVPLTDEQTETTGLVESGQAHSEESLAVFEQTVGAPMRFPGESLVQMGKKPWTLFD